MNNFKENKMYLYKGNLYLFKQVGKVSIEAINLLTNEYKYFMIDNDDFKANCVPIDSIKETNIVNVVIN